MAKRAPRFGKPRPMPRYGLHRWSDRELSLSGAPTAACTAWMSRAGSNAGKRNLAAESIPRLTRQIKRFTWDAETEMCIAWKPQQEKFSGKHRQGMELILPPLSPATRY